MVGRRIERIDVLKCILCVRVARVFAHGSKKNLELLFFFAQQKTRVRVLERLKQKKQTTNIFLSLSKDLPAELKHFIKQRKKKITMILRVTASETSRVQF